MVYSTGRISSALLSFSGIFVGTELVLDSDPHILPQQLHEPPSSTEEYPLLGKKTYAALPHSDSLASSPI